MTGEDRFRRSGIREIMDLAGRLDDVVHLEIGEPDFPTPAHVVEAVRQAMASGAVKYTLSRGDRSLRELLAERLGHRNGRALGPDDVVVTVGATGGVSAAITALLRPGDGILLPDVAWPTYELFAALLGARILRYRLLPEAGFEPDLEQLESLASSARLLVVNSPSNPTGAVLPRPVVEGLLEVARRHDLAVLSDEVYERIVFDGEHVSLGRLDEDGRVVTVHSFSKEYAMTGWRIGYLCAAPQVVEAVVRVQEASVACPSWVGQRAAEAALLGPQEPVERMVAAYRERRELALDACARHGLSALRPAATFYVLLRVGPLSLDTYAFARTLLQEQRVAVAPGETFGPGGRGLVRLSLASAPAAIEEGIGRIAAADGPNRRPAAGPS